jgi:uncharacterized protein (DUF488 family)
MIYTVGYQKLPIRRLDDLLECLEIDLLVDCRKRPFSTINGYSCGALKARYADKYVMKGEMLGGGGQTTQDGIDWLLHTSATKNVMLMCMEDFPMDCHRHTAICAPHFPDALHYYDGQLIEAKEMERAIQDDLECKVTARITFD